MGRRFLGSLLNWWSCAYGDQLPLSCSRDDSGAVTLEGGVACEDKSQIFISFLRPFSIYLMLGQQEPIGGGKYIFKGRLHHWPTLVAYESLFLCWPLKASWWQLQLWLQPRDRAAWDDLTANYFLVTCRGTSLMPHNLSPSTTPSTKLWPEMETSEDVKTYVCRNVAETYWLAGQSWPKSRDLRKWRSSRHDKSNGDLE